MPEAPPLPPAVTCAHFHLHRPGRLWLSWGRGTGAASAPGFPQLPAGLPHHCERPLVPTGALCLFSQDLMLPRWVALFVTVSFTSGRRTPLSRQPGTHEAKRNPRGSGRVVPAPSRSLWTG